MHIVPSSPESYQLLHDGMVALSQIEATGIAVDEDYLSKTITSTEKTVNRLQKELEDSKEWKEWKRVYPGKAVMGNKTQLAGLVFGKLGYEHPGTRTEKGQVTADEETFADVDLDFVKNYFKLEKHKKALNTYLKGLRRELVDGRFHPTFSLHTARSYRSSSGADKEALKGSGGGINFQNLPIRNPLIGRLIRKCFISRKGHLAEIDFSQLEVRVAAAVTGDPVLHKYLTDPHSDMHRDTAMGLFLLDEKQVEKRTTRDLAKNQFVFACFYGSVYFQMAPKIWKMLSRRQMKLADGTLVLDHLRNQGVVSLGPCDPQAGRPLPGTFEYVCKKVEDTFWQDRFRVYDQWKRDGWDDYLRTGHFELVTGFVVNAVHKRNDVGNYKVQGPAFHCLLQSLIWIQAWLHKHRMRTRIVGQIHDSLLLDIHPAELEDVLEACRYFMTVKLPKHWPWLTAPLEVECDLTPEGGAWADKAEVKPLVNPGRKLIYEEAQEGKGAWQWN